MNTTTTLNTFTINLSLEDQKMAILERLLKDGHITLAEAFTLKKEEPAVQDFGRQPYQPSYPYGWPTVMYSTPGTEMTYTNKCDGAMNTTSIN